MSGYSMTDGDKNTLRKNRLYLLRNVQPTQDLIDHLWSQKILTEDMREEIEVEKTTKAKMGCLLDILTRRGPDAFKEFIFGLMESEQSHAALKLDENYARQWESENTSSPKPKSSTVHPMRQISRGHQRPIRQPSAPIRPPMAQENESALLLVDVKRVDLEDEKILKLINNTKGVYSMKRQPRGRAIIINNSYFIKSPPREGAAYDSLNLCEHLEKLGFETVLYDDVDMQSMMDIFEQERLHEDHWNADCFLVFVLSHGSQGYVYGIDGLKLSIERDIVSKFDGNNCPALVDKPKMFFIQACQGDAVTEGSTSGVADSEVDAAPIPEGTAEMEQAFKDLRIQDTDQSVPRLGRTHEKSDIVLAYSTVPGYRSWRRTDLGSWFVRAIVEIFSEEAHNEDLLSLLVKVRQRVADHHTNHEDKSFIQLTRTDETTKKKIYFFPGYYETRRGDNV